MLIKIPEIKQPFRAYGESYVACFINYEGGVLPEIHDSVAMTGLVDCIDKITIDKDAFFGHDVMLLTGGHDPSLFGEERKGSTIKGPIHIKQGAWIGTRAIVLGRPGGIVIGEHSVVGAGSIVTKSVPDYEMWAGNPAKVIKKYDKERKEWISVK